MHSRHSILWRLLIDIPIALFVIAINVLLEVGIVPSHRNGFTCNDPALSFRYQGDTFSIPIVAFITFTAPLITIWVVETLFYREDEYSIKKNKLFIGAKSGFIIYKNYIHAAMINLTLLEAMKCLVGTPRPTFFDLCEPDKAKTCNGSEFITSYTCTSTRYSRYLQYDASRSFPSAHSALSIYCGLFIAWYLQRRAFSWRNRSVFIVPAVQLICLVYATVCPLTRWTDRRHHWWDVMVGAFFGFISVVYLIVVLCKNFSQPPVVSTSDLSSSDGNNHQSVRRLLASGPHVVVP